MRADLGTARAVAALFIVATVTAIIGGTMLLPIDEPDYLTAVAAAHDQMVTGALLEIVLVLSVVGIAVLIYPVLRRRNEGLALAYVGSRIVEASLLLTAAVSALVVLGLSDGATAGSSAAADVAVVTREWTYLLGSMAMLGVSAIILYTLLFQARLVPAWLSLWGLIGGVLILAGGLLEVYDVQLSVEVQALIAAPIGLQEMVMAIWLIIRGFDERRLAPAVDRVPRPLAPPSTQGLQAGASR